MASNTNIVGASTGTFVKLENVVLDVYAQEVLFAAQPVLRFESVATKKTDLTVNPGGTIRFLRYSALTGASAIAETATIETDTLSTSTLTISVSEHAKAVSMSELLLRQSITNVMGDASLLLGMHYAKGRDALCRDVLQASTNVLYAKNRASRATIVAADTFDVDLIRAAVELLATNKAPKFNLDAYICFVHPHQARYLRADSAWVNASNYGAPEQIFKGEIGRIEDVRFIETTMVPYVKEDTQDIWADGVDTGDNTAVAANTVTNVYRAIIVGQNAFGLAEALPVELRDNGVEDFGRKHSIGYYGIWGAGLIETGHVAVLETA
jgi:N4-gp56 family major capsid protein